MGQIISSLWNWLCPKKKTEIQKTEHHNTEYQPIIPVVDENQDSHTINIADRALSTVDNVDRNDQGVDFDHSSVSTTEIIIDLSGSDDFQEVVNKKRKNKKKESLNQSDQLITLEESAIPIALSHHVSSVEQIGQYRSSQKILLVGEGDFSFSACLAIAFVNAVNITATSLNSKKFLNKNYAMFGTNKAELESRGSMVLHGVDATNMEKHAILGSMTFDRIIFNFPHAGAFGHGATELRAHQKLIRGFLKNAKKMLVENGEIHITSKSCGFYLEWDIAKIGSDHSLDLIQEIKFRRNKYPGYNTKYGFGGDKDFDCEPSKTYKFKLSSPK